LFDEIPARRPDLGVFFHPVEADPPSGWLQCETVDACFDAILKARDRARKGRGR
jgi:hypothetical protein